MNAQEGIASVLPKGEQFGQTEPPLHEFIKGILDKYPMGGQILKELIQNADDAGATEVKFLLDSRTDAYGTSTLLHPSLAKFQGPALYAQNNEVFTRDDWKGIQSPSRSTKRDDPFKIGKFGIGFNSVYHLTDLPIITSGNRIGFLDPHKRVWPGEKGKCYSFDEAKLPEVKSQFEPLNVLGCDIFESPKYDGTLFRFPLRQNGSDSKISLNVWDSDRVLNVVFKSFQVDAHLILLFLKSVEKVSLLHWIPGKQEPDKIFSISISLGRIREVRKARDELLECAQKLSAHDGESKEVCFCAEVDWTSYEENDRNDHVTQSWRVLHRIDNSNSDVRTMAKTLHLTPCIGLAVPVGQKTRHAKEMGRIFCFLPLPPTEDDSSMTGLPVHVHGSFSVADDRRSLCWPAKDREHDSKAQWNYFLLEHVLPAAYASLICTLVALHSQEASNCSIDLHDVYSAWPVVENVRDHWNQKALLTLFSMLANRTVLYTDANDGEWIRPEEAVICDDDTSSADKSEQIAKQIMLCNDIYVASVPANVARCLSNVPNLSVKRLSPKLVRSTLRSKPRFLSSARTRDDQLKLLKYVLQDKKYSKLYDVTLLPVADGTMKTFQSRYSGGDPVYVCTDEHPMSLFPGIEENFVDSLVDRDLYDCLTSEEMQRETQIRVLLPDQVPELIKKILPNSKSLTIPRSSSNLVITDSWLSEIWKWLYHHSEILSSFIGCHIVPCDSNKCLVQLTPKMPVIFQQQRESNLQLVDEVVHGLRDLNCVVVDSNLRDLTNHPKINDYILPPYRVLSCLARLSNHTSTAPALLRCEARQPLLVYLSRVLGICKQTSKDKSILHVLPLFQLRNSLERTSIKLCSHIAPSPNHLPNDLPVKNQLIKFPDQEERKVLKYIARSQFLSFTDVIQNMVLPGFDSYAQFERIQIAKYVLSHQHLLDSDSRIFETLQSLKFVPVSSGDLKSPEETFDRKDRHISELFSGKPVLSCDLDLEKLIRSSPVSFRKISSITSRELLSIAQEASKGDLQKAQCLLLMIKEETWMDIKLKEKVTFRDLASALSNISWLPCLTKPPPGYPSSVGWKADSKTSKPSETLYISSHSLTKYVSVVGSQRVFLDFSDPLGDEVAQKLKFSVLTFDSIFQHLKTAVDCWTSDRVATDEREQFGEMMCTVLDVVGSGYSTAKEHVRGQLKRLNKEHIGWIWLDSTHGFVRMSQLVLNSNDWKLEDWRFSVSKFSHLRRCKQLLEDLGMKSTWDNSDLISLLKDLQEFHSTKPVKRHGLTKNRVQQDLRLSLLALNLLTKDKEVLPVHERKEVIYVPVDGPDDNLELAPSSEVTYCDTAWLDDTVAVKLIHRKVPHATAYALGVPSLIRRLAPSEELDFGVEEFGQNEPLTTRLNNILKEYKDDSSIFKELIQNADDAGATEVKFLVDWRQHSTSTLLSTGMADCQGPALLAYNNATFNREDFVNIAKLAAGTKRKLPSKIGRFGVGFSSIYHLTEVPSFVSDKYIVIFDPHRTHLGKYIKDPAKPGVKIDFTKTPLCKRFPDQFAPYHNVFDCRLDSSKPYTKTLFRFPFRTTQQAKVSEIKNEPCNQAKVQKLMEDLKAIANKLLLFLNYVRSVEMFELRSESKSMERLLLVESKTLKLTETADLPSYQDIVGRCMSLKRSTYLSASSIDPSLYTTAAVFEISKALQVDKTVDHELYLVCTTVGLEQAMKIARSRKGREVGCMPLGSVAIQLRLVKKSFVPKETSGEVFCGLPLSNSTGLPFHVNGFFAVHSNRRGLWWHNSEEHAIDRHRSFEPEWNDALIKDAVATASVKAIAMLQRLSVETCAEDYYQVWPNSQTNCHDMWNNLIREFYSKLTSANCLLMRTKASAEPPSWLPLSSCMFLSDSAKRLPHACSIAKQISDNFVETPLHVFRGLQSANRIKLQSLTRDDAEFISAVFESRAAVNLSQRNDLIMELLKRVVSGNASSALLDVLKRSRFVPTLPDGAVLRRPKELFARCDVTSELYSEEMFPCLKSKGDIQVMLLALKRLGMRTVSDLTWDNCLDRAKTVEQLIRKDSGAGMRRVTAVLQLVDLLEKKEAHLSQHNLNQLRKINFLPLMSRPDDYPLDKWHSDTCSEIVANAETLFSNELWDVVGSQALVLAPGLRLPRILSSQCRPTLDLLLRQLELVLEAFVTTDKQSHDPLKKMIFNVYKQLMLRYKVERNSRTKLSRLQQGRPWIYVQGHLLKPRQLSLRCTTQAQPYLYEVPEALRYLRSLLEAVGVRPTFGCEDFVWALQEMLKDWSGRILDEENISCVSSILSVLASKPFSELSEQMHVPLLSKDCYLLPATDLVYNDAPWLENTHDTDSIVFVHDSIPRLLALSLGVRPIRHEILHKFSSDIPGEPFGQEEKLTQRLNNILNDYPKGEEILKELLQNADDAKATLLYVIYDKRQHGKESVFSNEWKDLQGPAICVYNDRVFTDKDFEGIKNLGRGSKREDATVTGQYGIGLNIVYHLTDCPSLVTNNETLCVLDPHCKYFPKATKENPGRLIHDVTNTIWPKFSDIAHCYNALPEVQLVNGTLFRFPLRTAAMAQTSEIRKQSVEEVDVLQLFKKFKENAADMLLFLNSVCSIKLFVLDEQGVVSESFEVCANVESDDKQQRSELAAAITSCSSEKVRHKEACYSMSVRATDEENCRRWLIYQCIGNGCREKFSYQSEFALLPRAGIAAPVDEKLDAGKSRAYCFLPLPKSVQPKLPVHVNGHFELDSGRRSLWQESRVSGRGQIQSTARQRWNNDLVQFVIAPAYCQFLLKAAEFVRTQLINSKCEERPKQMDKLLDWYSHLFPRNNLVDYWQILSCEVYRFILDHKLSVFPYVSCPLPSDRPNLVSSEDGKPNPQERRLVDFDRTNFRQVPVIRWVAIEPENSLGLQPSYFFAPGTYKSSSDEGRVRMYMLKTILLNIGIPLVACPFHVLVSLQTADRSASAQTSDPTVAQTCGHSARAKKIDSAVVISFLRNYRKDEVGCKLQTGRVRDTVLRTTNNVKILLQYVVSKEYFRFDELEGVPLLLTADDFLRVFSSMSPAYLSQFSSLLPNDQRLFVHHAIYHVLLRADDLDTQNTVVQPFSPEKLVEHLPSSKLYDCKWEDIMIRSPAYVTWDNSRVGELPTKKWIMSLWRYLESSEGSYANSIEVLKPWPVVPAQDGTVLVPTSLLRSLFYFSSEYTQEHNLDLEQILRDLGATEIDAELMNRDCSGYELNPHTTKPPAPLHSLVKGRVAVLDDHVSVLKALDYLYSRKLHSETKNAFVAERILKYFDTALPTLRQRRLLDLLERLPLFETVDGKLSSIAGMKCYVVPRCVIPDGFEVWTKKRDHVFLKYKPQFEPLYRELRLNDKTCQELYLDCILPSFPKMKKQQRIQHLIFLEYCPNGSWSSVTNALKETLCFDFRDTVKPIGYFYDPTVELFQCMWSDDDFYPPDSPPGTDRDHWLRFLRNLGLKTVCPIEVFESFCDQMEQEALSWINYDQPDVVKWNEKSVLMCRHLFSYIDEYRCSLARVKTKKIVRCRQVESTLCELAAPFYEQKSQRYATSFSEAIMPSIVNEQLCWTSAAILPDYALPVFLSDDDVEALGLKSTPDIRAVSTHFNLVAQRICDVINKNLERKELDIRTFLDVVCRVFTYLENVHSCGHHAIAPKNGDKKTVIDALSDRPCIFIPLHETFVKPQQVVIELPHEIPPYLFKLPSYLDMHKAFLVKLGVEEKVTPSRYSQILREIHRRNSDQKLNGSGKAIKGAVCGLFTSLCESVSPSVSEIEFHESPPNELQATTEIEDCLMESLSPLYLPDRNMDLQLSQELVYLNRPEFERYIQQIGFSFLLNLQECGLPPLEEQTICLLPQKLRPRYFTKLFQEVLHPECKCNDAEDPWLQKVEKKYSNLLSSTFFAQGIRSIYTNKHRTVQLPSVVEQGLEVLQKNLQVKCLSEIRTHLQHIDSKEVIENSERTIRSFLERHDDDATLYISRNALSSDGQLKSQVAFRQIAKEIKRLLQTDLPESDLMVLLDCDEHSSVAEALEDLGIECIHTGIVTRSEQSEDTTDGEVQLGMPVSDGHKQLMHLALDETLLIPDNCVAYEMRENHFVYANIVHKDYSVHADSSTSTDMAETRYVIDMGKDDRVTVPAVDLYAFDDDQVESSQGQILALGQATAKPNETESIDCVLKQLEYSRRLPYETRRKRVIRMYREWSSKSNNPCATEVMELIKANVSQYHDENDFLGGSDAFLSTRTLKITASPRRNRTTMRLALPRQTYKYPDERKGKMFLAQAKCDLKAAEVLYEAATRDPQLYAAVCFHCHEAVEKTLKGILFIKEGIDEVKSKQHELDLFLHAAHSHEELLTHALMVRGKREYHYLATRYPDFHRPCCVPGHLYTYSDARRLLVGASGVIREVEKMEVISETHSIA